MATKKQSNEVQVVVKALQREAFEITIIGETPLITHAWSHKAKLEMLAKQLGVERVRQKKDPYQDYIDSMYRFDDGSYGFPVVALKECIATATTDLEGIAKAQIFRNLFVTGKRGFQIAAFADILSPIELGQLASPNPPVLREDMVRLGGMSRTPDLRYRAEFWPWAFRLNVSYFSDFLNYESIMNLLHQAGLRVGLGEWRQEKGGTNGSFHPADKAEIAEVNKWIKAGHKEPQILSVDDFVNSLRVDKKLKVASRRADIRAELDRIKSRHPQKLLEPKRIVQAAKSKNSPLHGCFTWDRDKAHERYLLYEARQLIAQYSIVVIKDNGKPIQYRNFVSLTTDRRAGGYRDIADIAADDDLTRQALEDAMAELDRFRAKYRYLKALIPIFQAMDEVERKEQIKAA